MDIDLSEDQELFRETTARFIEARCPIATVRAMADDPPLRDPGVARATRASSGGTPSSSPRNSAAGSRLGGPDARRGHRGRRARPHRPAGPVRGDQRRGLRPRRSGTTHQQETWLPRLASGDYSGGVGDQRRFGHPRAGALTARARGAGFELSGTAGLVAEAPARTSCWPPRSVTRGDVVQCLVPADAGGVEITRLDGPRHHPRSSPT